MKFVVLSGKDKLSRQEQLEFLDYLKSSLYNGFSLASSIEIMPLLWPRRKELMEKINLSMKQGNNFADELLNIGFAKTTVTQIRLAMNQGNLVDALDQLTTLSRLKNEQIKKIVVELSYPCVLAVMMISLLIFMQTFVASQFEQKVFAGDFLLLGLTFLSASIFYFLLKILKLLAKQDYFALKKLSHYVFIGPAVKLYVTYLLIYDIGLLLASGFSLQKMCEYAEKLDRGSLQQVIGCRIGHKLAQGKNLKQIIKEEKFLPDNLLLLLAGGQDRNNLSKSCLLLGENFFNELIRKIEKMVVSIQPICFIGLGICIIGMYLKLLLPMYAMMQGI